MAIDQSRLQRPFGVGPVLGAAFGLFFGRFAFYFPLALIAFVPAIIAFLIAPPFDPGAPSGVSEVGLAVTSILSLFCAGLLAAFATYAVVMEAKGHRVSWGATLSAATPRIGAVIVASLVVAVIVAVCTLLLVIPGLIAATILWVVIPVVVVERMGPFQSLSRSAALTKGNRWSIFGVIVVLAIINIAVEALIQRGLLPSFARSGNLTPFFVIAFLADMLLQMLHAIAAAYGYFHLKVAKEGADVDQLAEVFA